MGLLKEETKEALGWNFKRTILEAFLGLLWCNWDNLQIWLKQWRSEGRAWPGTCPAKAPCSYCSCHAISREVQGWWASIQQVPGQYQWPGYATGTKTSTCNVKREQEKENSHQSPETTKVRFVLKFWMHKPKLIMMNSFNKTDTCSILVIQCIIETQ